MSRKLVLAVFAGISAAIAIILIPTAINIATSELPQWVKDNKNWAWLVIGIFGSIAIVLAVASVRLTTDSDSPSSTEDFKDIIKNVNDAVYTANHDPLLTKEPEKRSATLDAWKIYADTLVNIYRKNQKRIGKQSKSSIKTSLDLLARLTNATKKSFLFLNRKKVFIDIASAAYRAGFEQKRWVYAAEMAYEVARAYHELEIYDDECDQWIKLLKTCLEKYGFHGFWIKVYDERETDVTTVFNIPNDANDKAIFFQALIWAANLYNLKGLHAFHASSDKEAQIYFDKARDRAQKLPNQMIYAWIEVHIGDLEDRSGSTTATQHYEEALKIANPPQPSGSSNPNSTPDPAQIVDSARLSDIVHLKLTCYNKLGRLAFVDEKPQQAIDWYEKQLDLAEKQGRRDFTVLAHKGLATIYFQSNPQDLQKASQHAIDAWNINQEFYNVFSEIEELKDFMNIIIDIMKNSIAKNVQTAT